LRSEINTQRFYSLCERTWHFGMSGTLMVAKLAIRFFGFCDLLSQLVQFGYRGFKDREPVPQIRNPIFGVIKRVHGFTH
jgi:hypothetical protein